MTQQENRDFTAGEAFYEARQNIKAAELFVDDNNLDKAYAAAFIAQSWIGLANGLHLRESAARWDELSLPGSGQTVESENAGGPIPVSVAAVLDMMPRAEHQHRGTCWHEFVGPTPPNTGPSKCKHCPETFRNETANQLCGARCPTQTHVHDGACEHDWIRTCTPDSVAECAHHCETKFSDETKDTLCPSFCPVAKVVEQATHAHGIGCEHDWIRTCTPDSVAECANHCETVFSEATKDTVCPSFCPDPGAS